MHRVFFGVVLSLFVHTAVAAPVVLTSIKPLGLIAAGVMDGVGTPEVLLPVGASHHEYNLKPSDISKIKEADVVFWVGPSLESFLVKPLSQKEKSNFYEPLIDSKGLHLRMYKHDHDHDHDHEDGPQPNASNTLSIDPHIWLSPENAIAIAQQMAITLGTADPGNRGLYQKNAELFAQKVYDKDKLIKVQLEPIKPKGYIVLHDGYGYFEDHFGLNHQGELTLSPERQPGAKHLAEIENKIKAGSVVCLFGEPQFQPRYLDSLVSALDIRRGTIDYLGSNVLITSDGYTDFLNTLANQFYDCLSK